MSGDEDLLRRRMARGSTMREWAEGPEGLFEVMAAVKANYLAGIVDSEPGETRLREDTYHRLRALEDIRRAMQVVITDGYAAEKLREAMNLKAEKKQHVA